MPRGPAKKPKTKATSQTVEATLWATADKLLGHLDGTDYKQIVLGPIILNCPTIEFKKKRLKGNSLSPPL